MPNYLTSVKLEFSPDPLSDTTPSWVDVSQWLVSVAFDDGKQRELDDNQAGGATFVLRNDFQSGANRRFEPGYAPGAYYPNIQPRRRFRLTVTADATTYQQGIWYTTAWTPQYLAQTAISQVTVTCVDGVGLLALDPLGPLDPPSAASYPDVVAFDQPYLYARLGETFGTKMTADVGAEGTYTGFGKGGVRLFQGPSLVTGDPATSLLFTSSRQGTSALDKTNHFADTNQITCEALINIVNVNTTSITLAAGPVSTGLGNHTFTLLISPINGFVEFDVFYNTSGGLASAQSPSSILAAATTYHLAGTWDGQTVTVYINGAPSASANFPGREVIIGDTGDNLYVGSVGVANPTVAIQDVAFYESALSPARIAAHAYAALTAGYALQDAGTRVAAIATNPLWSTAGISAGGFTVQPRMWTGQAKFDEVTTTAQAEKPSGLFFFDHSGNPQYLAWGDAQEGMVDAIFGDGAGEIAYDDLTLVFDDSQYNRSTIAATDGVVHEVDDTPSQPPILAYDDSGRILANDGDVQTVAQTIIDRYKDALYRIDAIQLNGARQPARTQILTRQIGDTIRIRRRGEGGTMIEIITRILGRSITIDTNRDLRCTYQLGRGFPADGYWHLGVDGFTELATNTVLA